MPCAPEPSGETAEDTDVVFEFAASTDNQGNAKVLNRVITTKFPLLGILCALAEAMEEADKDLEVGWVPRDENGEADDISNGHPEGFDPEREVFVDFDGPIFQRLRQLMELGEVFFEELRQEKERRRASGRVRHDVTASPMPTLQQRTGMLRVPSSTR